MYIYAYIHARANLGVCLPCKQYVDMLVSSGQSTVLAHVKLEQSPSTCQLNRGLQS